MTTPIRPNAHTWADLAKSEPLTRDEQIIDTTFWHVFSTPEGVKALEFMHLLTTFKRNEPNASGT